jgi:hypothetical protein
LEGHVKSCDPCVGGRGNIFFQGHPEDNQ